MRSCGKLKNTMELSIIKSEKEFAEKVEWIKNTGIESKSEYLKTTKEYLIRTQFS